MSDLFGDTPLWFVDTTERLAEMVDALKGQSVIGVDTESDSFHHYQEKVCLIQFSDLERDYIVDPLAIGDISSLGPFFSDPGVVKIFHGADYDIVCLNRDFGFTFTNLFDTMIAAQMAGMPRIGLADLIGRYFGITIDKQYQRHDWAKRPLKDEHIQYARGDTHFLLAIRELLMIRLERLGRMGHIEEECELLEQREFVPREPDPHPWLKTKRSNHLTDAQKRVLKHLWYYRDEQARKSDRPPFKILPDYVLVKAAEVRPEDLDALTRLFPKKTGMRRRYGKGMIQAILAGLEDDEPVPQVKRRKKKKKKKRSGPPRRLRGRQAERAMDALKQWRNDVVASEPGRTPVTVASNATLKTIAGVRPVTPDELRAIPGVRNWQVGDYGDDILAVLEDVVPAADLDGVDIDDDDDDDDETPESGGGRKRRRRRRRKGSGSGAGG